MARVMVKINGSEYQVDAGMTVLQACEQAGLEIPRFCYHDRLSVAGNCRMCLVEVKPGPPKPQASCALPVSDGQEILTHSDMAEKARHAVMEFLLINHPLDCPICDQGGECDLQDQAMAYGRGLSRYRDGKRAVGEKYMGPLIKTVMTRCIHCTRCVRFASEIAGVEDLGLFNRGEHAEISTLEQAISSELSGNLIDLCPVGALTSRPYAFHARPWELRKTHSIDVSSAEGANICIDGRGNEVLRVLPLLNEAVNEEWISDKARFSCDGLKRRRLDRVYMRAPNGKLQESTWDSAFARIAERISDSDSQAIGAIAGDLQDVESLYTLRCLWDKLGSPHRDCRQDGMLLGGGKRATYLFNSGIGGIDECDALLLIGVNPRHEAPLVNARIRKRWLSHDLAIGVIGCLPQGVARLNYDYKHLGDGRDALLDLADAKSPSFPSFARRLNSAKKPMLIIGCGVLNRSDSAAILQLIKLICHRYGVIGKNHNGYNILHRAAARVGGLDIGFIPKGRGLNAKAMARAAGKGDLRLLYLLGADDTPITAHADCLVVYQGHHGDRGAACADIILPAASYAEKDAIYVNMEGRVQLAQRAIFPPGEARADWAIIRALAGFCGQTLEFDDLGELRQKLYQAYPHMRHVNSLSHSDMSADDIGGKGVKNKFINKPLRADYDFYASNSIARASPSMQICKREWATSQAKGGDNV